MAKEKQPVVLDEKAAKLKALEAALGKIEKDFFGRAATPFKLITRKAIVPSDREIEINPRSRSARLRVAERVADEA